MSGEDVVVEVEVGLGFDVFVEFVVGWEEVVGVVFGLFLLLFEEFFVFVLVVGEVLGE